MSAYIKNGKAIMFVIDTIIPFAFHNQEITRDAVPELLRLEDITRCSRLVFSRTGMN